MGSGSDIHIEPEPAPPEGAGANYQLETLELSPHEGPAARPGRTRNPP